LFSFAPTTSPSFSKLFATKFRRPCATSFILTPLRIFCLVVIQAGDGSVSCWGFRVNAMWSCSALRTRSLPWNECFPSRWATAVESGLCFRVVAKSLQLHWAGLAVFMNASSSMCLTTCRPEIWKFSFVAGYEIMERGDYHMLSRWESIRGQDLLVIPGVSQTYQNLYITNNQLLNQSSLES
jgi:hypothetical protein